MKEKQVRMIRNFVTLIGPEVRESQSSLILWCAGGNMPDIPRFKGTGLEEDTSLSKKWIKVLVLSLLQRLEYPYMTQPGFMVRILKGRKEE